MQKVIKDIADELVQVAAAISAHIPNDEPFSVASGNWSFPGVTRSEILTKVKDTTLLVQAFPDEDISLEAAKYLADFPRRLTFLRAQTIPNTPGNAAGGVPAIYLTLQALNDALSGLQPPAPAEELAASVKRVTQQVRAMETRFKELTPRALDLETMVGRIELAHEAADRLPEDLASLNERQERADELLRFVDDDRVKVAAILARAVLADVKLTESTTEAAAVLEQCGAAYSANTSKVLGAAFAERSDELNKSMLAWVAGLVIALAIGAVWGAHQVASLSELVKAPGAPVGVVLVNLILALLSVGAPVWFAWMSTKQIGQRFRLSEDYAFKASISKAYEGYRREAARFDKEMGARLLASALDRLDELPLRLVEPDTHGSPWHEFASSPLVRDALKTVPGFFETISSSAAKGLDAVRAAKVASATTPKE